MIKELSMDELRNMKVGQKVIIDNNSLIVKVPNGWVYESINGCCFIPQHLGE